MSAIAAVTYHRRVDVCHRRFAIALRDDQPSAELYITSLDRTVTLVFNLTRVNYH